jgi:hypothetical protein
VSSIARQNGSGINAAYAAANRGLTNRQLASAITLIRRGTALAPVDMMPELAAMPKMTEGSRSRLRIRIDGKRLDRQIGEERTSWQVVSPDSLGRNRQKGAQAGAINQLERLC